MTYPRVGQPPGRRTRRMLPPKPSRLSIGLDGGSWEKRRDASNCRESGDPWRQANPGGHPAQSRPHSRPVCSPHLLEILFVERNLLVDSILVFVGILAFASLVFVFTHLRPLSDQEKRQLAEKRRRKNIQGYFSFSTTELTVNSEFKKRMSPSGRFYRVDESLHRFPSVAAALLKYKKHEWIIVAFEKKQNVNMIWLNKGFDRSQVSLNIPIGEIADIAKRGDYTSVLFFHNHPNSDPYYYDLSRPSNQDLYSANRLSSTLNVHGINSIEFVCERGAHYGYYASCADAFFPLSHFVVTIDRVNGSSKLTNLSLHVQRVFYRQAEPLQKRRRRHL